MLALALVACASTPHVPIDLQVDVDAALPEDAAWVKLCVADGVAEELPAEDGRYALTGLFPDGSPELEADVLTDDRTVLGRVGPVVLDHDYTVATYEGCDDCEPCVGTGDAPAPGEDSWTLGLRFTR